MTTVDMSSYLVAPLELDRICRACLMEKGDMRPLFGACLDEMLQSFTGLEIAENDGLPYHMCVQCVLQCSRAYTFKQLCEKSDGILKQYTSKEFQDALKEYRDQETCKNKVKKELEEQLNFRTGAAPLEHQSNHIPEESSIYESIINGQESDLPKSDIEDFYPTVDCGPDLSNDSIYNNSTDDDLSFKITQANLNEISSEDPEVQKKAGKYRCVKCDMDFALKVDLKVHVLSHEQTGQELELSCDICHKRFTHERVLRRHKKIHLQRKPHQCDQCDMTFAESSNLSKHKKKHTGELRNIKGKPHLCSVCGKSFKWASSLHKHSKYHTGHKLLSCTFCPKQYVEARSLKIHLRAHTGERPYSCDICNRTFTQMCNLDKHRRVHTGEKPYLCPICNKGFSQSGYIAIHMRTHTGDRPYVCQTCGKAFSGSSSLTLHERIHTGEKPYTCIVCNKSFSRHETLSNHVRSHTGDKPHVCTVCNKRFTSSAQLSGHMKTHSGEKTHSCEICGEKFAGTCSLKVHMKSHQQDLVEQVEEEEVVQEILPGIEYTCKLCDEILKDEAAVNTHILDVHAIQIKDDLEGLDAIQVTEIVVG